MTSIHPARIGDSTSPRNSRTRAASDRRAALGMLIATLRRWRQRAHQRQALRDLDDRLLADVGITSAAARREGGKSFWS